MKMKIFALILVVALSLLALASCGDKSNVNDDCQHTFDTEWSTSETEHWHAATCLHGEIKDSLAQHTDADEDGKCDVCAYEIGHVHTFADEWTFDETNHWHISTCSHKDEKSAYSLHKDENDDGACDDCTGHVHNVNAAAFCKHCGEKFGDIDDTSLDQLVAAVYAQKHLVNGGKIDYTFTGNSNTGSAYTALRNEIVDYIFGKDNYTYTHVATTSTNAGVELSGTLETWHQLRGQNETFGVFSEDGGALMLDISNANRLNGYYIALSTLAGEYGVTETLYALYEVAVGIVDDEADNLVSSKPVGDVVVDIVENENKVTFKYNYKTVFLNASDIAVGDLAGQRVYNVNYFEVEVAFCYSDDYALTKLWISCDCYTNDPGTNNQGQFLENDVDLDYDPATDSFTLRENALADNYTITVTQTVGERNEENPNPQSKFIPETFDLYLGFDDETGALSNKYDGSTIKADVRDIINLYVGDCTPEGTSIHFVADLVSIRLYNDNVEIENPEDYLNTTAVAMFTFAGEQRSFFIVPKADGAYRFEIYLMDEKIHEVNLHIGVVDDEYIDLKDNEFAAKITDAYTWTNEVSFTAKEAGTYYFNLPAGISFTNADLFDIAEEANKGVQSGVESTPYPDPYFDYHNKPDGGSFFLTLEAGETIRFYVSAAKRGTYVISYYMI